MKGITSPRRDMATSKITSPRRELERNIANKQPGRVRMKPAKRQDRDIEPNEFRTKIIEFCQSDSSDRTDENISIFLHAVEKAGSFQFLQKYSLTQKRQLANVVKLKQMKLDDMLFAQESAPDGLYSVIDGTCHLFKMQGDVRKVLAYAGPGDSIGDLSHLDERCRRSVSAQVVSETCCLMQFHKTDLDSLVVQWRIDEEEEKTLFIMKSVPILQCIPQSILQHLSPYFERIKFSKDTVIYHQQDDSTVMYFIWEGQVQLLKKIEVTKGMQNSVNPRKSSRSMSVAILNAGEYFGEIEVINNCLRSGAAVCHTDCTLLSLSKTSLTDSMPAAFLDALYRYSSMRLQWRNSRINLVIEALLNIGWVPDKDVKLYLEPEIKPLPRMKSVLLPPLPDRDRQIWLGAHTALSPDDAREWNLYYYGPWAQSPDLRVHDAKHGPGGPPGGPGSPLARRPAAQPISSSVEKSVQLLERRKAELVRASFFSLG